jgi:hypothetical protein
MRTAFLLSGQARFCKEFDTQLDNLKNSNIDWYVAFWKLRPGHEHFRNAIPEVIDYQYRDWLIPPTWSDSTARDFIESRLPDRHRLVDIKLFDYSEFPPMPREYTGHRIRCNPNSLFQQFWLVYQSDLLRQQHGQQYDLLIRSRADLGLKGPVDLEYAHQLLLQNQNVILTSADRRGNPIDDMFSIGLPDAIERYCSMVNYFDQIYVNNPRLDMATESFIAVTLSSLGLQFPMTNIGTTFRTVGTGVEDSVSGSKFLPDFGRWN